MATKVTIRFYKDSKVRGVWDDEQNKWFFSVLDIIGAINEQEDYRKNRNYWKYLKAKLKKEGSEVVSATTQLKLTAADGKKYYTDVISQDGVDKLAKSIRNPQAVDFLDWFTYSDNSIDGQSRKKAYTLWKRYPLITHTFTHSSWNTSPIKTGLLPSWTARRWAK